MRRIHIRKTIHIQTKKQCYYTKTDNTICPESKRATSKDRLEPAVHKTKGTFILYAVGSFSPEPPKEQRD